MNEYRALRVTAANGAATIRVVTNGAASPRRPGVEIRVHGVGDHAPFSALGEPGLDDTRKSQVLICEPVQLPSHKLFLVAWSRANRKLTRRLSWYLLFPFTLINLAGQMAPPGRGFERIVRLGVGITSVLLTASVAAWITVIVETIWRRSPTHRTTR